MFDKKYTMTADPPPPMGWDEYEQIVRNELSRLLQEYSGCNAPIGEQPIQKLLERHPCLIPGARGPDGGSGHAPFPLAVISQPLLPGFPHRRPDFMWLAMDSMYLSPIIVEIERPNKAWFTQANRITAQLTEAHGQLTQWQAWFAHPENIQQFFFYYDLPQDLRRLTLRPHYVLIYGRRDEANSSRQRADMRAQLPRTNETLMTYDRLEPDRWNDDFLCVRRENDGYQAITVPPTLTLGPAFADWLALIHDKDAAVRRSPYLSPERKEFLIQRFPYWSKMVADGLSVINLGDAE